MAAKLDKKLQNILKIIDKTFSTLDLNRKEEAFGLSEEIKNGIKSIVERQEENDVKIFVIGKVSSGKSTLINTLLNMDLFSAMEGDGTPSFFISRETDKDYEYYTINDGPEEKDMQSLNTFTRINNEPNDFIDKDTIIRVYIKVGKDSILSNKTAIIDCPGLGHSQLYDDKIEQFCKRADLFLFMFDVAAEATEKEMNLISRFKETSKKPTCLFVYSKCDTLPNISDDVLLSKKGKFERNFKNAYEGSLKRGKEPLYMISAKQEKETEKNEILHSEFERMQTAIKDHKKISHVRLKNIRSKEREELKQMRENISNLKGIVTESGETLKKWLEWLNDQILQDDNKDLAANALKMKVEFVVLDTIKRCDKPCDRSNHKEFLANLSEEVNKAISDKIESVIKTDWLPAASRALMGTPDFLDKSQIQLNLNFPYFETDLEIRFGFFDRTNQTAGIVKRQFLDYIKGKMSSILQMAVEHFQREVKNGINVKMYVSQLENTSNQLEECRKLVDDMLAQ